MASIPFYYDYACPWAYLGSCRVEAYFQDLGVDIDFRPVNLVELREPRPDAGELPKMGERKTKSYIDDLKYWGEMVGAEFQTRLPNRPRPDTRLLLKAALVAQDEGRFREFHYPAYRARWSQAAEVSDPEVVRSLLEGAGLGAGAVLARAESAPLDERLRQATQDAIDRGVFGVPTLFVGDRMFWGNDRFELVRYYLQKQATD